MANRPWKWLKRLVLYPVLVLSAAGTFGVSPAGESAYRAFQDNAVHWQANPEFRTTAIDYCIYGSAAMRARVFGFSADKIVLTLRSLPIVPKRYAADETSASHYRDFARGALSAYLHLCNEHGAHGTLGIVGECNDKTAPDLSPAAMGQMLGKFHWDHPVVNDIGASMSASATLQTARDCANPNQPFDAKEYDRNIGPQLMGPIADIAAGLGIPPDPHDMNPEQQRVVLERLDQHIYLHDRTLWRKKQVYDFFSGVWANVYARDYNMLIGVVLTFHTVSRYTLIGLLFLMVLMGPIVARKRKVDPDAGDESPVEAAEAIA